MGKFSIHYQKLKLLTAFIAVALFIYGCASVQQPTGGPRDKEAPKVLRESPKNLSRNFTAKKIEIEFDEFFKLSNEFKEISISPAIDKAPEFKVKKKILEITFQDTLEKNTTYTINFGKGIVDYNEGNILKNYSYVFATGNVIDSLQISGNVTNLATGKPELDATVFILPLKQDTLFGKKRASIFTTTDSSGNFTLRNLREDTYKIYALKEEGGDRVYNSTNEGIAFRKEPIVLNKNVTDIKLLTFKEDPSVFRVLDRKILSDGHLIYTFNQQLKKPGIKVLNPAELDAKKKIEFNRTGDSALVWFPEITFDSIVVAITDNGKALDTVNIRRGKKDTYNIVPTITDNTAGSGKIRERADLVLTVSAPVTNADATKITLLEDSIPKSIRLTRDTTSLRKYRITFPWRNKRTYNIQVNDNAFTTLLGGKNKSYSRAFSLDLDDNYANLHLKITAPDTTNYYLIQLISHDLPISTKAIKGSKTLDFLTIPAGTYTVRVIYDTNNNGKWDTGKVKEQIQPEHIWNYEKEILLRVNLEHEEPITIPQPQ